MDNDRTEGQWKQFKGRVKEKWGVAIDDEDKERDGHLDYIAGKIQEKTGEAKDSIRDTLRSLESSI